MRDCVCEERWTLGDRTAEGESGGEPRDIDALDGFQEPQSSPVSVTLSVLDTHPPGDGLGLVSLTSIVSFI